ncbi:oligosaccharide repeat unit polymerase Wzy [Streptococcus pneumoniae]|nr:oligosaccharide repeat unit polymerase Wzy [Streptococcus pneumoniae]
MISLYTLVFIVLVYFMAIFYWCTDFKRGKLIFKISDSSIKLKEE